MTDRTAMMPASLRNGAFRLRPIKDRVLARRIEEKQTSLIHTPDSAKEKSLQCEVVAVGTKVEEIEAGDIIIIGKFVDVDFEREKLLVCNEADVRLVVDDKRWIADADSTYLDSLLTHFPDKVTELQMLHLIDAGYLEVILTNKGKERHEEFKNIRNAKEWIDA